MKTFLGSILGQIVSVAGCFETVNGCFDSRKVEVKILCDGYMLTGKVERKDLKKASLEVGDFVPVHGDDIFYQCDEEARKKHGITEEIPDEFELCNPTIHNWICFCDNHAIMKKLPADSPYVE